MSTSSRPRLKTAFEKSRVISPLYTGGPVAVTPDGLQIITCVGEDAILTHLEDGLELCRFAGDTATIYSLCLTPSSSSLIVFTASLSLHFYDYPNSTKTVPKTVRPNRSVPRAHEAPVHVCKVDPTSTYLASGSADGVVKVWDVLRGYVTHSFSGHGGVVSALAFNYPFDASSTAYTGKMQLITASVDTRLRIFDLSSDASRNGSSKAVAVLEGHVSVPRGLDVSPDGKWLISGGRDSVVLIWELSDNSFQKAGKTKDKKRVNHLPTLVKTIPILDCVEAVGLLRSDEISGGSSEASPTLTFYTGGEKGLIKIWDGWKGTALFTLGLEEAALSDEQQRQIVDAIYSPSTSMIISVHADQNITCHSLTTQSISRHLIGFNDEIIDMTYLSPSGTDSHVAIAANSSLIRVYPTTANDAVLLSGHSGIVLCLDHGLSGRIFASGSKDNSARVWAYDAKRGTWGCVAVCEGHAENVGAIALSKGCSGSDQGSTPPKFMFTGSQDQTIKMWDLSEISPAYDGSLLKPPPRCKSLTTHKAHDKDINTLDIAPNDRLLASGSQDRTAKVYEIQYTVAGLGRARGEIKLLGTCKGHKRGVWTVRFGKTERVLATGSGDKTIKLWNLDDYSCVKTFEGHTSSVLRIDLINHDLQMVSSASDGLLKLWNVRNEECIASMDNHDDKVWALAVSTDESTVVTGGADSIVTFWKDCTEKRNQEEETRRADMVMKEQDFMNYLSLNDYQNAIQLALAMDQPGRLLTLFKKITTVVLSQPDQYEHQFSVTGDPVVDVVLRTLPPFQLIRLFQHVQTWNTSASTSAVAQIVLHALLKLRTAEDIGNAFHANNMSPGDVNTTLSIRDSNSALSEVAQALIPYTERHLARMDRLIQESYILELVLGEMDNGMFVDEDNMVFDEI